MVLLYKIVDHFKDHFSKIVDLFNKFVVFSNKIVDLFDKFVACSNKVVELFGKIVDLLFERGGSSAPREPPLATGLRMFTSIMEEHQSLTCILRMYVQIFCYLDINSSVLYLANYLSLVYVWTMDCG